jgi:hypothetical protein
MDYKTLLTIVSSALLLISVIPYFLDIYRGTTKPHAFTWTVWGILTTIGFIVQITSDAGIASLALGITALLNFIIAGIGFWQKQIHFTKFDWFSFGGAILAIFLWWLTENPLWAVILLAISDFLGYLPTYKKSYYHPNQETIKTFLMGSLGTLLSIFALANMSIINWLYPAQIVLSNIILILIVLFRRRQVGK